MHNQESITIDRWQRAQEFAAQVDAQAGLRLNNMVSEMLHAKPASRPLEAFACAAGACTLLPDRAEPWIALAAACDQLRQFAHLQSEAARIALTIDPNNPMAWHNLALAEMKLYQWDDALVSANNAHRNNPANPYHLLLSASLAWQLSKWPLAEQLFSGALHAFGPTDDSIKLTDDGRKFLHECHAARSTIYAQLGDWDKAFADAWMGRKYAYRNYITHLCEKNKVWRAGKGLKLGNKVLLALEFGLGDQIQAARLIPVFQQAHPDKRIAVACTQQLVSLFQDSFPGITVVPSFAAEVQGMFTQQWTVVPHSELEYWNHLQGNYALGEWPGKPYLHVATRDDGRDGAAVSWAPACKPGHVAIAFCWQGNPNHNYDWARSIPVEFFANWISDRQAAGVKATYHSVQYGVSGVGPTDPMTVLPDHVENCAAHLTDMRATALALRKFDIVVGCDTSVMHLAGALGIPTVMLNCYARDWRWTMPKHLYDPALFVSITQQRPGDWLSVFNQLGSTIDKVLDHVETRELANAVRSTNAPTSAAPVTVPVTVNA